ncbi:MAG: DoxX family protein [Flavipsychrobacter sp.]|nr:DoxX family protein [Flavipsychrobacter sp.]
MTQQTSRPKGLHIALWILQIGLGAIFVMAGIMKSSQPIAELSKTLPWTAQIPEGLVRFIGVCELLGGIGLVLPSIVRIKPKLSPIAAVGLATVMILAIVYHVSQDEVNIVGLNLALGLAAGFVAWGRFKKAPIQSR